MLVQDEVSFNLSKFITKWHDAKDLPYVDEVERIASIVIPPAGPSKQYLLKNKKYFN